MDVKLAYITVGSREEAERIAEAVVTEKLAACANILPGVRSIFEWQGRVCHEDETLLLLKTVTGQSEKLVARIKEMHSYECPCIIFLPLEGGNPDFFDWVRNSL